MLRTINHTSKVKILVGDFIFFLHKQKDGFHLEVQTGEFDKKQYPANARLIIEGHANTTRQRIECGEIKELVLPKTLLLDELDSSSPILFDVKVVDRIQNNGALLALGKGFRPHVGDTEKPEDDESNSKTNLLPIRLFSLEAKLWEVNFDSQKTTLYINNKFPSLQNKLASDPLTQALILPSAIKDILMRYCVIENEDEYLNKKRWIKFAEELWEKKPTLEGNFSNLDDLNEWIDEVVKEFSERNDMLKKLFYKSESYND